MLQAVFMGPAKAEGKHRVLCAQAVEQIKIKTNPLESSERKQRQTNKAKALFTSFNV